MMSSSARIIILCEGTQDAVFLRRFLALSNVKGHEIRVKHSPQGEGDAKKWIETVLPNELKGFRGYNAKNRSEKRILCVMADADDRTVAERIQQLAKGCDPRPSGSGNVCFIIPRWAVETWLQYLRGEQFDESVKIRPRDKYDNARDCWPQVDRLKAMCDSGTLDPPVPPSLSDACQQFQQMQSALNG